MFPSGFVDSGYGGEGRKLCPIKKEMQQSTEGGGEYNACKLP